MGSLSALLRLAALLCFCRVSLQGPGERRLYDDLMKQYNRLGRPVQNDSDVLTVQFGISLMQILDVDEKNQALTTNLWLSTEWEDSSLKWNPADYPGVKNLRFSYSMLWTPDIVLFNSGNNHRDAASHPDILVHSSGDCIVISPAILTTVCKMDMRWFPFDEQRCELRFGSWTYDGNALELKMKDTEIESYTPSGEWDLVELPGEKKVTFYQCCPDTPYQDITYTAVLRRRALFYGLNLLLPGVLISTLALMVFLLPADSGEKISLGLTVLLSLTVFMLLLADVTPATSHTTPLIAQYFATVLVIVGLSVMATVLVLHFHHHDPRGAKMPQWTRVFLLDWCAWLLQMKRPGEDKGPKGLSSVHSPPNDSVPGPHGHPDSDKGEKMELLTPSSVEPELGRILDEVRYIAARFREAVVKETVANEWKFAGAVIDRLCLLLFFLITIFCTVSILMVAPHFGK